MKLTPQFFVLISFLILNESCQNSTNGSPSSNVAKTNEYEKSEKITTPTEPSVKTFEGCPTQVRVKKGESFKIILKGNPSTGYTWAVNPLNYKLLQFVKVYPEETPQNSEPVVGAPQRLGFEFKALDAATTEIVLEYKRVWEKVPATEKCSVQVVIEN